MKNGNRTKSVNKHLNKIRMDPAIPKQWDVFSMQVAMEPYSQLGTGKRCKAKQCGQPVYDSKLGLCSYHRMKQQEQAFENQLKARQQLEN